MIMPLFLVSYNPPTFFKKSFILFLTEHFNHSLKRDDGKIGKKIGLYSELSEHIYRIFRVGTYSKG